MKYILLSVMAILSLVNFSPTPYSAAELKAISLPDHTKIKSADGYYFDRSDHTAAYAVVLVIRHKDSLSIVKEWNAIGNIPKLEENKKLYGFTNWSFQNGIARCSMHIIDPEIKYVPEFIGHEFVHCINGNFHPYKFP